MSIDEVLLMAIIVPLLIFPIVLIIIDSCTKDK